MEKEGTELKTERLWETGYLVLLAVYLLEAFLKTTMFPITWPEHAHDVLQCALAVFVILKFAYGSVPLKGKKAVTTAVVTLCFLLSSAISEYWVVRDVLFLALGAYRVPFRKILTVYLVVLGPALLITMGAALTGKIENLIYYQGDRRARISFGIGYPTDFAAYLFFGAVIYCCWRRTTFHWWEIAGIEGLAVFSWYFCDARNNAGCLALVGLGTAVLKVWALCTKRREEGYYLPKVLQTILIGVPVVLPGMICMVTVLYDSTIPFLRMLNAFLGDRLALGKRGVDYLGLTLFGQQVAMNGKGMSTEPTLDYFFLDSSYVLIGMRFGIVLLALLCLLFVWYLLQLLRKKQVFPMMLLAVLFLQCTLEHHFFEYVYNPFLLLGLSMWDGCFAGRETICKRGNTGG